MSTRARGHLTHCNNNNNNIFGLYLINSKYYNIIITLCCNIGRGCLANTKPKMLNNTFIRYIYIVLRVNISIVV